MLRKILFLSTLILFCGIDVLPQACGYVFARIYVNDPSGAPIRNAKFEFLESKNRKMWAVHGQDVVKWIEKDSLYLLEEGMCGGHRDVLIRVSAEGFADANKIVDLHLRNPSRPYIFRITLNLKDSKLESSFETLSFLSGRIFDANGSLVTHTKVTATDSSGKKYSTQAMAMANISSNCPTTSTNPAMQTFVRRSTRSSSGLQAVCDEGLRLHTIAIWRYEIRCRS